MSFAGNLEDLAIVDVIQLLHSTRKSGTLSVHCDKGRGQLVFNNGFIVSANHLDSSVRIGNILVEMGLINVKMLQQTLTEQKKAGADSLPLIGMLIQKKVLNNELAYKGLECLIEMTIAEMVSWNKGTFTLDIDQVTINDEYRYIPENLHQEQNFDTQMVLMDALRIYDEKKAARTSAVGLEEVSPVDTENLTTDKTETASEEPELDLSADILGLDAIEQIDIKIQKTFTSIEAFDPAEIHRQKVREMLPDFSAIQREELVTYLASKTNIAENQGKDDQQQAIILYSPDGLVQHGLTSSCKNEQIMVFSALTPQEFEDKVTQNLDRSLTPILTFDCPSEAQNDFSKAEITGLRQQMAVRFPHLKSVQIAAPLDYLYALKSLQTGASAVIPRSIAENHRDSFIPDFIQFLESFPIVIHGLYRQQSNSQFSKADLLCELSKMRTATEISHFLLEQTSHFFDRSLTLILRQKELRAEKSFGIRSDKIQGSSEPLRFKIPVTENTLLAEVIEKGTLFLDAIEDKTIRDSIFGEISAPNKSKILLLPLIANGKTLALIYADFGQSPVKKIDTEYLQSLAWLAGLALERIIRNRQKNQ